MRKQATKRDSQGRAMPAHRKAAVVIWKSKKDRKFYFHLRSSNGKVVISNNQGYNRRDMLIKTLKAVSEIFRQARFIIEEPQ